MAKVSGQKLKAPKGLLIYLLGFYVLVQFCWWAYMLVNLNAEIHHLKMALLSATEQVGPEFLIRKAELDQKLTLRVWMVLGEGAVFVSLLLLGFWAVRRSISKELSVAEQQKNFLLSITHELKSPLAAIKLQIQTLNARKLDDERRDIIYDRMLNDTNRLEKLVESLLLVNKVEAGGLPLNREKTDVSDFINEQLRSAFVQQFESGLIQFDSSMAVSVELDRMAMQIILHNLISNALKYGGEHPVMLRLESQNSENMCIHVLDKGVGIPDREKEKVFERFYRVGNEEVRQSKGTGIGLYLVKLLVEKHGGKISVRDNLPTGTCFTVTLPVV